jgi:hypothetical protein
MDQLPLDFNPPTRYAQWYDSRRGWQNDHVGWYEHTIYNEDRDQLREKLHEVVDYLYEQVDNCERHCRWMINSHYIRVKFRHERDALLFVLRF